MDKAKIKEQWLENRLTRCPFCKQDIVSLSDDCCSYCGKRLVGLKNLLVALGDRCTFCEQGVVSLDGAFCSCCGQPNPEFSAPYFEQSWKITIEQVIDDECENGHPELKECIKECPVLHQDHLYCRDCGKQLF